MTPPWLDNTFFEENLRNYYKNEFLKVINFEIKSTAGNDEGYTSSMFRAKVNFSAHPTDQNQTSTIDLIIKVAVSQGTMESFSNYDLYAKEIEFYSEIAPKINGKLKELDELQLLPECFGVCKTNKVMIMEDLGAKGYTLLPAQPGYNISQSKAILKRMATFHAINAVLYEENPNLFASKNFQRGHFSRDVDVFNNLFTGNLDGLLDTISTWPDFSAYYEKLRRVRMDVIERWRNTYDVNQNHFNTFVHDDLWPANIMMTGVKPSEETPFENVVFIDFQLSFWASPTIDLHFFLNTSVCDSYRPHRFDELVESYHECLVSYLKQLKFKGHIPTWTEFYAQYQERKLLAFIASCLEQANTIDNNGEVTLEDMLRIDDYGMKIKRSLYQKPKVQEIVRKMIPFYDQIGTFD